MTCEEVRISLGAHVLGALDDEEAAEVEAHLDGCAACREELAELSVLPPLLARVPAETIERDIERAATPPRAVLDRLVTDRLVTGSARRGRRSRALLALAASVLVAAAGGTTWLSAAQNTSDSTTQSTAAGPAAAALKRSGQAGQAGQTDEAAAAKAGQAPAADADAPVAILGAPASPAPAPSPPRSAPSVAPRVGQPPPEEKVTTTPGEYAARSGDVRLTVRLDPYAAGTRVVARVAGVRAGTVCTLRAVGADGMVSPVGSWTVGRGEYRGQKMVLEGSTALRSAQIRRIELAGADGRVLVSVRT